MAGEQAVQASLFATLDAEAVMQQMKASPFLLAQQRRASAPSRSDSPTPKAPTHQAAGGTTPIPPTPAGTASLSPAASLVTLMSGLTLQSAGGPASPTDSSGHASLSDALDSCFSADALAGSGSDLSHAGSMELPPALQALLQQHAQQRSGPATSRAESISAANSGLLSSGAPSAPASPPKSEGSQHSAFPGFAACQSLPLEVHAYLQQQEQQQQAAAAVAAVAAAAAQEQQAALGWAPGNSASTQSADSFTGGCSTQTWPAGCAGGAAYQSAVYGWGGQLLSVEAQQAAADVPVAHGTLPQALFSLQLPQRLQLQALLAQRQQQQFQQQPYGCGSAFGTPALLPQPSNYALRRAAQAPQDPPETLLGPHGRYQPYCKQFITPELNTAASSVLCCVKMLQCIDGSRASRHDSKRFFCSLKEVSKVVCDARCLIVAPDVQPSSTAAINPVRALQRILNDAQCYGVPVVFALSRRGIGQVFGRDKAMSIVALMRLDGLEPHLSTMMEAAAQGRVAYMSRRDAAVLPLEARLLGTPAPASLAPASLAPAPAQSLTSAHSLPVAHSLTSAQSLPMAHSLAPAHSLPVGAQAGLGGASTAQWLQSLQGSQALASAALASVSGSW